MKTKKWNNKNYQSHYLDLFIYDIEKFQIIRKI